MYKDSLPIGGQPSSQEVERAKVRGTQCLVKCCEDNTRLVPKLIAKYKASLKTCY